MSDAAAPDHMRIDPPAHPTYNQLHPPRSPLHHTNQQQDQPGSSLDAAVKTLYQKKHEEWLEAVHQRTPSALETNRTRLQEALQHDLAAIAALPQCNRPLASCPTRQATNNNNNSNGNGNGGGGSFTTTAPLSTAPLPPPPPIDHPIDHTNIDEFNERTVLPLTTHKTHVKYSLNNQPIHIKPFTVPLSGSIPNYKAWSHLKANTLSYQVGQRMFYTERETGETVPVEDDNDSDADEEWMDGLILDGLERECVDKFLMHLVHTLGEDLSTIQSAAKVLDVNDVMTLRERIADLLWLEDGQPVVNWRENKAENYGCVDSDFLSAWCRQCRAYGCNIHQTTSYRPVNGPIKVRRKRGGGDGGGFNGGDRKTAAVLLHMNNDDEDVDMVDAEKDDADRYEGCGVHCYKMMLKQDKKDNSDEAPQQQQQVDATNNTTTTNKTTTDALNGAIHNMNIHHQQQEQQQQHIPQQGTTTTGTALVVLTAVPARKRQCDIQLVITADSLAAVNVNAPIPHTNKNNNNNNTARDDSNNIASTIKPLEEETVAPTTTTPIAAAPTDTTRPKPTSTNDNNEWSAWEKDMLAVGVEMWGHNSPCNIATLIHTKNCSQVYTILQADIEAGGVYSSEEEKEEELQQQGRSKGRRKKAAKVVKKKPMVAWERHKKSSTDPHVMWPQYEPCNCTGPCRDTCPCGGNLNFCEKFCACDPDLCRNRFPGCVCKGSKLLGRRCTTKACPCLAAGRECDPDLCTDCRPTLSGAHREGWDCRNFRIRLGQKRRVLMGMSDVQGWGAFTQQSVPKDGFLGEYCGELVDHEEADRRGKVYDRDDNSYLFNLNQEWVIDARHKGNKLRFANHSSQANSRAQILMVDGDHRVAILANKDVEAGDELFYDYNYLAQVAPDWARRGSRKPPPE